MKGNNCGDGLAAVQTTCDVVCFLPLELVVHVVEYLDVADIVRCQRVWNFPFRGSRLIQAESIPGCARSRSDGTRFSRATE